MRDVAARAGTSAITVSRVLAGHQGTYSAEMRERVLQAARELAYKPVAVTTQNRPQRTQTVGVLFTEPPHSVLWSCADGLHEAAQQAGYDFLVRTLLHCDIARLSEADAERLLCDERVLERLLDRRCDGYIFIGHAPRTLLTWLREHQVLTVSCSGGDVPPGVPVVIFDNAGVVEQLWRHLWEQGHRRIGFVCGPVWHTSARERRSAFETLAHAANCHAPIINEDAQSWHLSEKGRDELQSLPAGAATAWICANDPLAFEVGTLLRAKGRRVPDDVSLVGIDDVRDATAFDLTTCALPFRELGAQAFRVFRELEQNAPGSLPQQSWHRVPGQLIVRGSTAPPSF